MLCFPTKKGGSKRGWTTWLLGAVDTRVKAMIPIVMDFLNVNESMEHHYRAYGGWTWLFGDYYNENYMNVFRTPEGKLLADIVDPYSYFDRYHQIDKYVVSGPLDPFFQPDNSLFWWNDLPGPKQFFLVPNAEVLPFS